MATKIADLITLDGTFGDWPATDMIMTSANTVAGYQVYGALLDDATLGEAYVIGIAATASTDPVIDPGTIIYLNTDQNDTTGYSPFGNVGAEYEVQFLLDATGALQPYLYSVTSSGDATLLNGGAPLDAGFSSDGESVELAIPQALLTPTGGAAPTTINFDTLINDADGLPTDFTNDPEYTITDPATVAPPTTIADLITLDGTFGDWPVADMIMTSANAVAGYQVYGALLDDATLGEAYVIGIAATASTDPVIDPGTIIYLNTDQNDTTGYSPFGNVGAEYEVQFLLDATGSLQPYLYSVTSSGAATLLNGGASLDAGFSSDGESVELAIPQVLLTPTGGAAPTTINFDTLINGTNGLPSDFTNNPEYIINDPTVPPTTIGNLITLDGSFSDWPPSDTVTDPANVAPGYQIDGAFLDDATLGNTYVIGIDATDAVEPVIGLDATLYLNTDQNDASGYELPFANIGAEYEVQFAYGPNADLQPYLYSVTSGGATTLLNGGAPLNAGLSSNDESIELAIPQALLTPTGNAAPTSINFVALNGAQGLPTDLASDPEYTITDPAALPPATNTHKVAIVYSDTSAALYFSQTAYSDLFMAAQNQARMAGVSFDIIDKSQLTNINNLIGYSAIIFPSMPDVNTAALPAIMSTLTSAVYNYHIGIITAGDFLTNDQTGAPLPGNSYSNMETLLGLARVSGGNDGAVTVTANNVTNPIMKSYSAGQVIQTYPDEGYAAYQAVGGTATDVLVNQNVIDPTLPTGPETIPGVIQTTTGGTNVQFATTDLEGDSNLLSNAIQSVVLGTQPGVALHMSRDAGVVAVRMDMDQSQFPSDVSPTDPNTGQPLPGIYDTLIPILQQWNQQYNFVGSYFINIGDNPNSDDPSTTNWTVSLPYYKALLAMGSEIGTHSYTHLINPPTETFTATTSGDTPAGSTQITLTDPPPSFAGVTVGMFVTGTGLGTNTPLPGAAGEGGSIANSQVTAVSGDTITISYVPQGYGTANDGTIADIPAGTTLTFSIPSENTNFLQTGTVGATTGSNGDPFTYDYEFEQSAALKSQELGIPIEGAAVPGANETFATDQNIVPYFQSVAPTSTTPGYTGFLSGGWTGVGSGYPSAIGYMSPSATDEGSLYIAPNVTFDFTEIQYEGKSVAEAEADWASQFNALTTNAAGTPVVVLPIHDYGVAQWNTTTDSPTGSPYSTEMYQDFIAQAYADNYEFLTLEELAARTEAQQKATINYTTNGNAITATVTPDPSAPDVGGMALNVINGGTQVIQNVTNWYAYNAQELFLPTKGGTFTINLGATQDDVTHIESLPMRGDLLSVTGDGLNLSFAMAGTGDVLVDLGGATTLTPIVTGATVVGAPTVVNGQNQLELSLTSAGENDVSITLTSPPTITGTVAGQATTDLATIAPFSGVTIADVNANQTETVTITQSVVANGTLSNLGTGSYDPSTGVYAVAGTAAAVTAALDALVFVPTANQVALGQTVTTDFTISDTDTAGATATDSTTTVVATDMAAPPTISGTVGGQAITDLQTATPFAMVTIADGNIGQTETVTVTLSAAANGTLSNLGGFANTSAGVYTDITNAATVTSDLDNLVFTPTANQVAPGQTVTTGFIITDTDTVGATATDSTTAVVATDVAVPPTISGTVAGQAVTDLATVAPFATVTIGDGNIGQTEMVTVTLSAAANGTLSNLASGSYNATSGIYTDTGTAAVVTAALDGLAFTPTANQVAPGQTVTTTFTVADTDTAGATATDNTTTVVATDVAAPPTISGTAAGQATPDLATVTPFSKVTISDGNIGQTETVTVTLSAAANGALSNLGGGVYAATAGVYTDTGTAAAVTVALEALIFTPTANQVAPGQAVTTIFTIVDTDTALASASDSTTTVIATDVGAPTLAAPPSATISQGAIAPIAGVSLAEVGSVSTETFTVTLTDTNGKLAATGAGVSGSGTTSLTISGALAAVNTALATLSDTDATTPSDTIKLSAVDSFGVAAAPQSIAVTVTPGQTFTLTTGKDAVAGGPGNNTIVAKTNTLTTTDSINGGTGTNTLQLVGGGTFNLAAPATLTNIAFITAQEGQGTTAQTVTLRAGLNATVNVASDATTDTSPTITITGAANSDIINLGTGNDTVTLGAGETVNSGGGNNAFKVALATLAGVTINGGTKGKNTLSITGGGTAVMGSAITGITTVQLASATTFTANAAAGLTIVGSAGADNISAGGASQVLTGGAGVNMLTGSSAGGDIFRDTAADLNGDTVANLLASDVIDITDLAPATTTISKVTISGASTVLTLASGTTTSKITLSGTFQGNFAVAADTTGGGGTDLTFVPTANLSTVTLPTTPVTITTGPVSTTIIATAATLLPADKITGGTGTGVSNTLQLSGGGEFNLAAVSKLTNFQVIAAQEGQGATAQTVTLKAGLNATVNVAPDTAGDPAPGITIIGGNNSDVINLGAGNDTVTPGAGETVNGGTGTNVYNVTKTTIGNTTIKGGSGSNTLVVTGGGNATMGAAITGINAVQLATTTNFTANTTVGLKITGSSAGGDTITLGAPTQSVVAGGPNETVKATAANAVAAISGLGAKSTLDITSGGTITLNANTDVATVALTTKSTLILNGMQFITADGSTGADTIEAGAINQTLTGGAGADTLIGFSGGQDIFRDTAANLNGDTVQDFVTSDTIDLTNLTFASAKVTAAASGANTKVTVASGATKSVFTLAGAWSSAGFHLATDGAAGTFLTHT